MAHPKVLAEILPLALHNPQYARHATRASRRVRRVHACPVVAVRNVDAPVARNRVRVNRLRRRDAVLPLLLHLGVHHQQRVVRQMDRNLALGI